MKRLNQSDLAQLLAERPFEMLTSAEQEAVLAEMPEWEYQRLHQLLQRSKATMKRSPKPDPAIRERLLEVLRQQPKQTAQPAKQPGLLVRMAQYRLPAWQAAAGLALLLVAHFALQKTPREVPHTETVYVNSTDTIYKEVAIPVAQQQEKATQMRVNVKPRLVRNAEQPTMEAIAYADTSARQSGSLPDTMPGFNFTPQSPIGRSANEMKDLWQLLGDVY
ncbi:MAG: hypothetical protein IPN76_14805 [Saprospiraceae bacterium]|nr:hypothetical protein [Saprospiraceae bacterium]